MTTSNKDRKRPFFPGFPGAALTGISLLTGPFQAMAAPTVSSPWDVQLGAGAGVSPTFEGANSYRLDPLPWVRIMWRDRVSLGLEGLSVKLISSDQARFGLRLGYNDGREEDDDDALQGLGDIDETIEGGLFARYQMGSATLSANLNTDLGDQHNGVLVTVGVTYGTQLAERVTGSIGTSLAWADADYTQTYFGVTPLQSARSGLGTYDPGSGIKNVGVNAFVSYAITERWSVSFVSAYTRLTGDTGDSPVVEDKNQFFAAGFVVHAF